MKEQVMKDYFLYRYEGCFSAPTRQAHAWGDTFPGTALNEYTS
jgi:hypothetical protein